MCMPQGNPGFHAFLTKMKHQHIINYCFPFLVKAAILNVEIGTLFDPEVASKLKGGEETCIKCSQRINEIVEKPIDLSTSEDIEME